MPFKNDIKQTYEDAAYLATRDRFWTTRPFEGEEEGHCAYCDEYFTYTFTGWLRRARMYCSPQCRRQASYDRQKAQAWEGTHAHVR